MCTTSNLYFLSSSEDTANDVAHSFQDGDPEAFAQLVDLFQDRFYRVAYRVLGNTDEALDVVQDAFLKLFRSRETFEDGRPLEPWLLRIAGNASRDVLRRRKTSAQPVAGAGDLLMHLLEDPRSRLDEQRSATRLAVWAT